LKFFFPAAHAQNIFLHHWQFFAARMVQNTARQFISSRLNFSPPEIIFLFIVAGVNPAHAVED